MIYATDSVISFTPDRGYMIVCNDGTELPVIGWAVYVRWRAADSRAKRHLHPDDPEDEIQTEIQPVVLADGDAMPMITWCAAHEIPADFEYIIKEK